MKTVWFFLVTVVLSLSACVMSAVQSERNADGSPAEIALYPSQAAPIYLAAALIDSAGQTINSISGTVYCGDGLNQKPANLARIELLDKSKVLTTVTTDVGGTYTLKYKPGFKGDFQFSITARCGNLRETLRPELVKNHAQVDFWVK